MSFKLRLDPRSRAAGRFVGRVTREIQKAYERELRGRRLNQSKLAQLLGIDRSVVHRQLKIGSNLQLRTLAEYAWALDHDIEIELVPKAQGVTSGSNLPSTTPAVTAATTAGTNAQQSIVTTRVNAATLSVVSVASHAG